MDAPLPVPTWMRVLLLMALRNVKEVAPRRNARGVPMGPLQLPSIITPNYGGFKKRTEFNFLVYTESNSTRRIKLRVR